MPVWWFTFWSITTAHPLESELWCIKVTQAVDIPLGSQHTILVLELIVQFTLTPAMRTPSDKS